MWFFFQAGRGKIYFLICVFFLNPKYNIAYATLQFWQMYTIFFFFIYKRRSLNIPGQLFLFSYFRDEWWILFVYWKGRHYNPRCSAQERIRRTTKRWLTGRVEGRPVPTSTLLGSAKYTGMFVFFQVLRALGGLWWDPWRRRLGPGGVVQEGGRKADDFIVFFRCGESQKGGILVLFRYAEVLGGEGNTNDILVFSGVDRSKMMEATVMISLYYSDVERSRRTEVTNDFHFFFQLWKCPGGRRLQ